MGNLPLVLAIKTNAPQSHGYVAGKIVRLAILVGYAIAKRLKVIRRIAPVNPWRIVKEVVVADIVAAEVLAELERVIAPRPGEVVDDLVLGNVAPLWEAGRPIVRAGEVVYAGILVEGLSIIERSRRRGRGEQCCVVAEGRRKLVGEVWREHVSFRSLCIPGRLRRQGVESCIDGIDRRGLRAMVELVTAKEVVAVA